MDDATARPWWNESGVIHAANGRGGATHPATCEKEVNAALIVKAVNAHDSLVEALQFIQVQTQDVSIERLCAAALEEAKA